MTKRGKGGSPAFWGVVCLLPDIATKDERKRGLKGEGEKKRLTDVAVFLLSRRLSLSQRSKNKGKTEKGRKKTRSNHRRILLLSEDEERDICPVQRKGGKEVLEGQKKEKKKGKKVGGGWLSSCNYFISSSCWLCCLKPSRPKGEKKKKGGGRERQKVPGRFPHSNPVSPVAQGEREEKDTKKKKDDTGA